MSILLLPILIDMLQRRILSRFPLLNEINRLLLADSLKAQNLNAQERDVEPSSEGKVVVDELQIEDILEDSKVITVPEDTRGS